MMPAVDNTPTELPPMQPMAIELLDCWAVEFAEHNALREQCGLAPRPGRTYSREDRLKGRLLHPTAMLVNESDLVTALKE